MGLAGSHVPFVFALSAVCVADPLLAAASPADAFSPLGRAYDVDVVSEVADAYFVCAIAAVAMAGVYIPGVTVVVYAAAQVEIPAAVPFSEHQCVLAWSLRGSS